MKWKDVNVGEIREWYFRDLLAEQEDGRIEVRLATGKADVMTNTHVFEVERLRTWKAGLRQAVKYGTACLQRPALALVADFWEWRRLPEVWAMVRAQDVEVWWLMAGYFVPVTDAEQAEHYAEFGTRMAAEYGEPASTYDGQGSVLVPALPRTILARERRLHRAALKAGLAFSLCERSGSLPPGARAATISAIRLCWLAARCGRWADPAQRAPG